MELWTEIRRQVLTGQMSRREACRRHGLHWLTLKKILEHDEPPGYRRTKPPRRPKIDPFRPIIQAILDADRSAPKKQRHTAHRLWQRLRAEHGFTGGYTSVKDVVRELAAGHREVFLPLSHPRGEAQVDFGYAEVVLGGVTTQVAIFVLSLPYSDAVYCQAFPRECTEVFAEGHARAFAFLGGVPRRIAYDNTKTAVAKITGSRQRQVTRVPEVAESLPVRPALLPGPAAEREGACRAVARLRPIELSRPSAGGGFPGRVERPARRAMSAGFGSDGAR
jgi:transposase